MNPDSPRTPREEMETWLTALLLGELSTGEAAAVRELIKHDPELAKLHERLQKAIVLVREAESEKKTEPAHEPLQLSDERRQRLLASFTIPPLKPEHGQPKSSSRKRWVEAVALFAVLGLLGMMALPNFVKSRSTSQSNAIINDLRQLDAAKQQWALESKQPGDAQPTWDDIEPYLGRGSGDRRGAEFAGGRFEIGRVDASPKAFTEKGTLSLEGTIAAPAKPAPALVNKGPTSELRFKTWGLEQKRLGEGKDGAVSSFGAEPAATPVSEPGLNATTIVLPDMEVNGDAAGALVTGTSGVEAKDVTAGAAEIPQAFYRSQGGGGGGGGAGGRLTSSDWFASGGTLAAGEFFAGNPAIRPSSGLSVMGDDFSRVPARGVQATGGADAFYSFSPGGGGMGGGGAMPATPPERLPAAVPVDASENALFARRYGGFAVTNSIALAESRRLSEFQLGRRLELERGSLADAPRNEGRLSKGDGAVAGKIETVSGTGVYSQNVVGYVTQPALPGVNGQPPTEESVRQQEGVVTTLGGTARVPAGSTGVGTGIDTLAAALNVPATITSNGQVYRFTGYDDPGGSVLTAQAGSGNYPSISAQQPMPRYRLVATNQVKDIALNASTSTEYREKEREPEQLKRKLPSSAQPTLYARTNLAFAGGGRQAIGSKLDRIRLNEVAFDGLSLGEVLRELTEVSKTRDPEKRGVNFVFNPNSSDQASIVDPTTGLPVSRPLDVNAISIKLNPGLSDVRLADVLDAVAMTANQPLKYSIEDNAVVFSVDEDKARTSPKPKALAPIPQPEISARENPFSTFSLNVSDVSFKLAMASLEKGQMPDAASVRSEEFINAFDYRDPEPAAGAPIAFAWERARYPFAHNRDLLRFSLKTAAAGRQAGRPLNVVLLLDNSGSMERADRVRIIREALRVLVSQLQPLDKLSVITFARTARLVADGISGDKAGEVAEQVSGLTPQGGTNLEDAINLAYQTAARHYLVNGINRVVLLTDGAANLGDVEPDSLKQKVEAQRKQGIALDCFGIGWEGFNDDLLEVLSRNGDGRYGFINSPEEAATEFAGQLAGALKVAASDVKVQVEFNPRRVTSYRQIGYAKHQLTKEQFRDNTVDAAEIAAQEAGNALYTVEVNPAGDGPLCTVRVRYKISGTGEYREQAWAVPFTGNALSLEQSSPAMRLAGSASAIAEWLAASPFAGEVAPDKLLTLMRGVPEVFGADSRPKKLEWMIRQAKSLEGK